MNFTAVLKRTGVLLLTAYLMIAVHWLFGLLFLGALLYNVWYWFTAYNKFKAGDVNPGKVVSLNPDRVAVATNMSKFGGQYPILRIVEVKLPKYERKVGAFIPTVALYYDNPYEYPFWAEFHPVPVSHGVSSKATLQGKLNTFSQEDFLAIDTYLQEVNTTEPGTYRVQLATSGWQDYPEVEVGDIDKIPAPAE